MVKIIDNKSEWDAFLNDIRNFDFYHTYDYHQVLKKDNETPILVVYVKGNIKIGFPLIKRKIFNTNYYDLTSVHGYLGPISNSLINFNDSEFKEELNKFLLENNFVAAFSKLNPFIENQNTILNSLGETSEVSVLVYIDLKLSLEKQFQVYSKNLKRHLNKARKSCYVKKAETQEDIDAFIKVYYDNMDRLNAKKTFYYSKEYFNTILNNQLFETEILLAIENETNHVVAGVMFVKTHNIIQAELIATATNFMHLSASKIVIDEMRIKATTENKQLYLNLGGGSGGLNGTLVSRYKLPFSQKYLPLKVWKYIINEEVYENLVKANTKQESQNNDFFPLYRQP